jgi:predicted ArsR family transcriptional regulator
MTPAPDPVRTPPSSVHTRAYYVGRALSAVEILAFGPATATQIADALQVHSRTARAKLNRMVHDGCLSAATAFVRPTY